MSVPPHLASTRRLLWAAFGGPVPPGMVLPVIRVLYDHMSDRNLADVMADVNGGEAVWLNEVYRAAALAVDDPDVRRARMTLLRHGLASWLDGP
ncbi:MAG: hypothetical protein KTR31_11055 [Myxococcales bacterium]|nr:hypothetical protein [Myxococcales bacterium]